MSLFGTRRIYLDHASSTPVSTASIRAMRKAEKLIGNPSSIHKEGVEAKKMLEKSRAGIASEIGCKAREIIFTSGITESNSLAILGFARKRQVVGGGMAGTHWITSSIEHASVLECFREIKRMGGMVSRVDPDARGIITPDAVARLLRTETVFVSVGWANNEIGIVQPLTAIRQALRKHEEKHGTRVIFHTDVGQGLLYRPLQAHTLGIDLLVIGGSKLYGPHGVSALYVSNRVAISPIILGGGQERGLRAGTENVALAAGFAEALIQIAREREAETKRLGKLRDILAQGLISGIRGLVVNGDLQHALPHILNVSIPNIQSEYLILALDRAGIAISTKSACNEGEAKSHVVGALPIAGQGAIDGDWRARNTLRFSLGRATSSGDIKKTCNECISIMDRLYSGR